MGRLQEEGRAFCCRLNWLHPLFPSAKIGRLYQLHREKKVSIEGVVADGKGGIGAMMTTAKRVGLLLYIRSTEEHSRIGLKVVGNEKVGGSRRWHMIDIGLGQW